MNSGTESVRGGVLPKAAGTGRAIGESIKFISASRTARGCAWADCRCTTLRGVPIAETWRACGPCNNIAMTVNSTHADYDANLVAWLSIRDVLAGDTAIKRAREKSASRLDAMTDGDFAACVTRGYFYNATARTVSGYVGMILRRDPVLLTPDETLTRLPALRQVLGGADFLGTTFDGYAKNVIEEVVSLGRAGTLVDWHGAPPTETRAKLQRADEAVV